MRYPRIAIVPVALAAAFALSSCGPDEPAEFEDTSTSSATGEEPAAAGDQPADPDESTEDGDQAEGTPATVDVDPADVIAETSYPLPEHAVDSAGGTVTAGVHALQVNGSTMLLTVYLTPEFDGEDSVNLFQMHGREAFRPVLNDRQNLKQYVVLREDALVDGAIWSTYSGNRGAEAASGETIVWWGYYAAPEDDIDSIAVSVYPGAAELDVPIER